MSVQLYHNPQSRAAMTHWLLEELGIPHVYRDGPKRAHHWESGWLDETVELLLRVREPTPASAR